MAGTEADGASATLRGLPRSAQLRGRRTPSTWPVWEGDEGRAPKGEVQWSLDGLHAERFFFHQQFMHVVRATR